MKETQQSVISGRLMPSAEETTKIIDSLVEQSSRSEVDQATINKIKCDLEAFPALDIPWSVGDKAVPR